MKKFKRICSIILAMVCLTGIFASCKEDKAVSDGGEKENVYNLKTTHGGKVEATSEKIVEIGKSDYKIVKSANSSTNVDMAVVTLQDFFNRATGITLPVVSDDQVSYSTDSKYIVIGDTTLRQAADVSYDVKELTEDGFVIKTVGKSIFLCGGSRGELYGVYDLLKYFFDFEYYAENAYQLNTSVIDLPLYDFDVKEIPDIEFRAAYSGIPKATSDVYYKNSLRVWDGSLITGPNNTPWHNTYTYIPYEEYGAAHREWFGTVEHVPIQETVIKPAQLCYTRRPDEFRPIVVEKMKELILANPDRTHFSFVQQDAGMFCECESCLAAKQKYGGNAGAMMVFINKVANDIAEWQKTDDRVKDRRIQIVGMSYTDSYEPPVKKDENGNYVAVDDLVKSPSNVEMILALRGDKYYPFNSTQNKAIYENAKAWSAICDQLMCWTYPLLVPTNYIQFNDVYNTLQEDFKLMVECNVTWVYPQGAWDSNNVTAFQVLTQYLISKLTWNCQMDFDAAIDGFFKACYGPAEKAMRAMFDANRARTAYCRDKKIITATMEDLMKTSIYPYAWVKQLETYIEEAYAAIEPLKEINSTAYQSYKNRICLESLNPRYMLIELYSNKYTDSDLLAAKLAFKTDCELLSVTQCGGATRTMEWLFKQWGIA